MINKRKIFHRKPGEKIIFHMRRHWFVFLKIIILFVILLFIPIGIYIFLKINAPEFLVGAISYPIFVVSIFTYYLVMLALILTIWTDTYLDVWTITSERIISRKQKGLFNRIVSELDLYRVQDVTAEQKGFFPTILHYGRVYIQTAGSKERFIFEQIANPYRIAKTIQQLDEKAKQNYNHDHVNGKV